MVWLPSELDPSGEMAFRGTLLLLREMAADAQARGGLTTDRKGYVRAPSAEDSWKKERQMSFIFWQLATNPDPTRVIGHWWMSTWESIGNRRNLSFFLTAHCTHPADEARSGLYFTRCLSEDTYYRMNPDSSWGKAFYRLWRLPDTHTQKELTTGKLAELLELLAEIHEWDPIPEELRRDLEERLHAKGRADGLDCRTLYR